MVYISIFPMRSFLNSTLNILQSLLADGLSSSHEDIVKVGILYVRKGIEAHSLNENTLRAFIELIAHESVGISSLVSEGTVR